MGSGQPSGPVPSPTSARQSSPPRLWGKLDSEIALCGALASPPCQMKWPREPAEFQLRRDLEDDPVVTCSARACRAVQIAVRVEYDITPGLCPVAAGWATGAEVVK